MLYKTVQIWYQYVFKLQHCGIRGAVLQLFENCMKENNMINCGVPQGSIIVPLMFSFLHMLLFPILSCHRIKIQKKLFLVLGMKLAPMLQ